ncbi:hypothetical protein A8C32_01350 [Flavivirga aquatica]|uniref:BIG2 domain-containing protein n=1 Tax=Flavivirga aquatica TaxID=1849968 RepID=A0A1E5T9R6_9FLAO|nr:Ig-like domain-containing protein [Flavivirga aquatica]OEK08135.1 hypothetical protein A8C32_01350 [Flavivirga aquatica]
MKKQLEFLLMFMLYITFFPSQAQLRVGDPGVTIDQSKFDSDYPQMARWANAGVRGGIPFINSFNIVKTITEGNSDKINAEILNMANDLSGGQKGLIKLSNGDYNINKSITMKSNVSLQGESRNGVVCTITMNNNDAFSFRDVQKCGIYNLTIKGSWDTPKYPWNYSLDANKEFSNSNVSIKLTGTTKDCWLDKVSIINSAKDPLRCPADHNTFRDLIVDGCKRKAGGAEGYFFIQGRDNLITGCEITHLRHISLQGSNVEYNVVYDNDFKQEISFHSGDAGNNLISNNRITLPSDMPPLERGEKGPFPETENGKPIYFAIMGPWSTKHRNSDKPNYLYKNKCVQDNHNYGSRTPWSDNSKVYFGPKKLGLSIQERIDNFPAFSGGAPSGGTLYAVNIGDNTIPVNATEVLLAPTLVALSVGKAKNLNATVLPNNASNKSVTWSSNNTSVASINANGRVTAISAGTAIVTVTTIDGNKTATSTVTVTGGGNPTPGQSYTETFSNMTLTGWGNETYTGDNSFVWNIIAAKGSSNNVKNSKDIYFRSGKTGVKSTPIAGGISSFSVKCKDRVAGTAHILELLINGDVVGTSTHNNGTDLYTFEVNDIDIAGNITIELKNNSATNKQNHIAIDDITWTTYNRNLNILNISKDNLVKTINQDISISPNPFQNKIKLRFNQEGIQKVNIMDIHGRIVYYKELQENIQELNISSPKNLKEGMYFLNFTKKNGVNKTIKLIKKD